MRTGMMSARPVASAKAASGPSRAGAAGRAHPAVAGPAVLGEARAERNAERTADVVMRNQRPDAAVLAPRGAADAQAGTNVPETARETVRSAGAPLGLAMQRMFEPRFGRSLGDVRVHTGAQAAASARALDANAYTVGRDIVFGANQYAPGSDAGNRLLAHELAHVVQRDPGAPVVRRDAAAGDAKGFVDNFIGFMDTNAAEVRVDGMAPRRKDDDAKAAAKVSGLEARLPKWLTMVENVQSVIDTSLQGDAALSERVRAAYKGAVEAVVAFTMSRRSQTRHEVYQSFRGKITDWALPQGAADKNADELTATLTRAELQKLTVVTAAIDFDIDPLFSTTGGRMTVPLPDGVTPHFGTGAPAALQRGLSNIAGKLIPNPLALNATTTLALDLEPYGGDYSAWRYTFVEHPPVKKSPGTQEVLIEHLGTAGIDGLSKSQAAAAGKKFAAHGFIRADGWQDADFEAVLQGIAVIADPILQPVDGITFARGTVKKNEPDTAGDYNPATHTLTLYNRAFTASMTRFGGPAGGLSSGAGRAIAHEIGHAIDLLPLRKATADVKTKQAAFRDTMAPYESSPGSNNYNFPTREVRDTFNRLQSDITKAEKAEFALRTESGQRDVAQADGTIETVQGGTAAGTIEFRKAALKDSATRVTGYANKEWQEYYAEALSFYIADPATLERLRPTVFAFFVKHHPKQAVAP